MDTIRRDTGYIDVGSTAIYYERAGEGAPVLLLHAGVSDSRMWDDQVPALAPDHMVVRFDARGFGRTRVAPGAFSDFDDVAAVMDALAIESATIVGISLGAAIAIEICLAYPERVRALVLASPALGGHEDSEEMIAFGEAEREALARGDIDGAVELNVRTWVDGVGRSPDSLDPAMRDFIAATQRAIFEMKLPDGVVARSMDPPAAERLREIDVPTRIITGEFDLPSFVEIGRRLHGEIPGATLVSMPAAHLMNLESPDAFNDTVRSFLAETRRP